MESDQDNLNPSVIDDPVEDQTRISILDLNQHCLLQVFRYLDVYDAINFGETCKLLQTVSLLAMTKFKNFVLNDCLWDESSWKVMGKIRTEKNESIREIMSRIPKALPLEKVLSYVAPHITSMDARTEATERKYNSFSMLNPSEMRARAERLQVFLQFDMPKTKSLIVENSEHLAYIISRRTVEKLTIYELNANGLNNYASGMRNLTQLHLYYISHDVATDELSRIVENNPNIEDLSLVSRINFPHAEFEFSVDLIPKLPQLKHLELSIGSNAEILQSILQIQQLTKLALVIRYGFNGGRLNIFLRELAKKNTVRSLELKNVDFEFDNRLFVTLASMNLTSLHVDASCGTNFLAALTHATFPTLKNLELRYPPTIDEIILIIKHFKALERLVLLLVLKEEYASNTFSKQISELLKVTPTARPDIEMEVRAYGALVKISFNRGNCEFISWREPIDLSAFGTPYRYELW